MWWQAVSARWGPIVGWLRWLLLEQRFWFAFETRFDLIVTELLFWKFEAKMHDSLVALHQTEESDIWRHPAWRPEHCIAFREACAGAGALGMGLSRVGFQLCARNELQEATAEVLRQQGLSPTIQGDISDFSRPLKASL